MIKLLFMMLVFNFKSASIFGLDDEDEMFPPNEKRFLSANHHLLSRVSVKYYEKVIRILLLVS